MYVCMYVCMYHTDYAEVTYVHMYFDHLNACMCKKNTSICGSYMYVCMNMCMYVCMYVCRKHYSGNKSSKV